MVQDMTEGKPLKMILSFSIPLLIGNLFQQLYNMADSGIVGRMVGMNALAALAMKKVCAVLWPCPFCFVSSLPFC